jgi:CelD/BcsL family acetyltransferase involved in cellulose biosynthesis
MSVDGRPAAVLFGLAQNGRFMFLLMGYDLVRLRNYSLGLLMLESTIEECIARGDLVFDLTIGDESYKRDFANRSVPMMALWTGIQPLPRLAHTAFAYIVKMRSWKQHARRLKDAVYRSRNASMIMHIASIVPAVV